MTKVNNVENIERGSSTEITVKGHPGSVTKSGRWFIAKLDNGGVAAQGRTAEDAINKLRNKIERFDDKVKDQCPTRRDCGRRG